MSSAVSAVSEVSTASDGARDLGTERADGELSAPAAFTLLGADTGPGCVGDECALPAPPPAD